MMMRKTLISTAALVVITACASSGRAVERGQPFLGRSMIVSPRGELLAGPASHDREEVILAECNLMESRLRKRKTRLNHIVLDRRTDVYDVLLGYEDIPFRR